MEFQHSQSTREWQQQVRQFVEQELIPWEVEAELNNGVIPQEVSEKMQRNAIALGLSKMDAPTEHGGLGMSMVDQLACLGGAGACHQCPVLVFP
jgi:alkylation response protein AidB-like acyl-CoA dehydrogenase